MPVYDLIIGKQTMHDLGVKLDFQEKTITIDKILLPMRNIVNLQLKPRIELTLLQRGLRLFVKGRIHFERVGDIELVKRSVKSYITILSGQCAVISGIFATALS